MRERQVDRLLRDLGEEVARQEGTVDWDRWRGYSDDPVGFSVEVLGDEPWQAQRDIARAVAHNDRVTVRSCHAAGKDWLSARLALWFVYARHGVVVLTGPTADQVQEILMRNEIRKALRGSGLPAEPGVKAMRVTADARAGIIARTSTHVSGLTGIHDSDAMFMITEAQHPDCDDAFEAGMGTITGPRDRMLAVGNPTRQTGRFYKAHKPDSDWFSFKIQAQDVPNVREEREVIPGLMSIQGVRRFIGEYGVDSPIVQSKVFAEFPDQTEDSLFRRSLLEAAATAHADGVFDIPDRAVVALDVARAGPNESALAIRRGSVIRDIVTWSTDSAATLTEEVRAELKKRGLADALVVVDATGMGGYVADRLRQLKFTVLDFVGGANPDYHPDKFLNLRAESYWKLRLLLEERGVALPASEALFEELMATKYRINNDGKIQLERKAKIAARVGRSPDRADAVTMALYPPVGAGGEIPGGGPPETDEPEQPDNFIPPSLNASPI